MDTINDKTPFTPSAVDKPTFTENDLDPDFVELLNTRIDQAKHTKGLSLAEFVTEYDSRKRGRE